MRISALDRCGVALIKIPLRQVVVTQVVKMVLANLNLWLRPIIRIHRPHPPYKGD
jgi:hypothetical protein